MPGVAGINGGDGKLCPTCGADCNNYPCTCPSERVSVPDTGKPIQMGDDITYEEVEVPINSTVELATPRELNKLKMALGEKPQSPAQSLHEKIEAKLNEFRLLNELRERQAKLCGFDVCSLRVCLGDVNGGPTQYRMLEPWEQEMVLTGKVQAIEENTGKIEKIVEPPKPSRPPEWFERVYLSFLQTPEGKRNYPHPSGLPQIGDPFPKEYSCNAEAARTAVPESKPGPMTMDQIGDIVNRVEQEMNKHGEGETT